VKGGILLAIVSALPSLDVKNTRPELEAHYADILRVLLSREAE
jgi:hypothetical protein